ncbi:DnaJ domain-containing protein [candidate division KSB1 bacterium]
MTDLSRFNYKKFSLEDRERLRELRKRLRQLWFPPMEKEINEWRRRSGVNSSRGLREFAQLSREEKVRFFADAHVFIRLIENASSEWYRRKFSLKEGSLERAYRALHLDTDAPFGKVRKQYRHLVLKSHPDRGGRPQEFVEIVSAYRLICAASVTDEEVA